MKIMVAIIPPCPNITSMLPTYFPQASCYVITHKLQWLHINEGKEAKVALLSLFLANCCQHTTYCKKKTILMAKLKTRSRKE
jgi:hypothetical protein